MKRLLKWIAGIAVVCFMGIGIWGEFDIETTTAATPTEAVEPAEQSTEVSEPVDTLPSTATSAAFTRTPQPMPVITNTPVVPTVTPIVVTDWLELCDANENGRVTCKEANSCGVRHPVKSTHPIFQHMNDNDDDGYVCE